MSIKRMLAASGLVGLLGALAFAVPASAAGIKVSCVIQGTAKTDPTVPLVGGKGEYTFDEIEFVCAGVEKLTSPVVVTFSVTSEGVYKNLVCGTGKAMSTRNIVQQEAVILGEPKTNFAALVPLLKYTVEFAALSGQLYWHDPRVHKASTGKLTAAVFDPKPHETKDYGLGGYVQILPDPLKQPPGGEPCTKSFQVAATITIDTEPLPV